MSSPAVVVLCALPFEAVGLLRSAYYQQRIPRLIVCSGGLGARHFTQSLRVLSGANFSPRLLILAGLCGGLHPLAQTGAAFLASVPLTSPPSATLPGQLFAPPGQRLTPTPGVLISRPTAAETVAQKNALTAAYPSAMVVDMESLFAWSTLHELVADGHLPTNLHVRVVRVVSDGPQDAFPVPTAVLWNAEKNRPATGSLLGFLFRHPDRLGAFLRFVRQAGQARHQLTRQVLTECRQALG